MLRADIINGLLKLVSNPRYLEIGVWRGDTFIHIHSEHKVAVDPKFEFEYRSAEHNRPFVSFYEMTSNAYFAGHAPNDRKFDVVFLDGLHTFEQTLTDILHAVDRTKENGFIVIDDVIPDSYAASMRSEEECHRFRKSLDDQSTHWMGDVYKLVFFINNFMLNWTYFTVAETHGQVIMWRKSRLSGATVSKTVSEISEQSYKDVVLNKEVFNILPFSDIIEAAKHRVG